MDGPRTRFLFATCAVVAILIENPAQAAAECKISHCRLQYVETLGEPHLEIWKGDIQDRECRLDGCDADDTFHTFTIVRSQCHGITLDDATAHFLDDGKSRSAQFLEPTCEPSR
jgi:hypothetical protein